MSACAHESLPRKHVRMRPYQESMCTYGAGKGEVDVHIYNSQGKEVEPTNIPFLFACSQHDSHPSPLFPLPLANTPPRDDDVPYSTIT